MTKAEQAEWDRLTIRVEQRMERIHAMMVKVSSLQDQVDQDFDRLQELKGIAKPERKRLSKRPMVM